MDPLSTPTAPFLLIIVAIMVAWETWTVLNHIPNDTESEVIKAAFYAAPVVLYAFGLLSGHWVSPVCSPEFEDILFAATITALAWLWDWHSENKYMPRFRFMLAFCGGSMGFPQGCS